MQKSVLFFKTPAYALACFFLIWPSFISAQKNERYQNSKTEDVVGDSAHRTVDDYLSRAEKFGYQGVVLAVKDDKVVLKKAFGYADREAGAKFTVHTRFPIASEVKIFTAAAIVKLEEQGKLRIEDSIAKYLPNAPEDKRAVTIHHLLTHTAGLPAYSGKDDEVISRETLVQRMMAVKLSSKPGEKYSYSNPGYSLLAVLIELVSGMPYEGFVQRELFRPAGMTETSSRTRSGARLCAYLAMETTCRELGERKTLPDGLSWNVRGNAGFFSTVDDLFKWHLAMKNKTVLSPASVEKIFTPHAASSSQTKLGYSWFLSTTKRNTRVQYMSGGDQNVAAYFRRFPDEDAVVIQFTNNAWGASRRINDVIPDVLFGAAAAVLPVAKAKLTESSLSRFAGTYKLASGEEFSVIVKNGQLAILGSEPGAAKQILALPDLAGEKLLENIHPRVSRMVTGLSVNDLEPIREAFWRSEKFEDEKAYWTPTWKEWTERWGKYTTSEVLGTTENKTGKDRILETWALIRFQNGTRLVNFRQDPDGNFYIDTSTTDLLPAYFQFVPVSDTEFVTYNFRLKTESKIKFQTVNDRVTGLTFLNGRCVSAKRLS